LSTAGEDLIYSGRL